MRDYITTFATETVVILSTLFVYRIAAQRFGIDGFAEYAIARRVLALLVPLSSVGLDVALTRIIAGSDGSPRARRSYVLAATIVAALALVAVATPFALVPELAAAILFGSPALHPVAGAMPLLVVGATIHVIAYAQLRGRGRIQSANALMLVDHALVPPIAMVVAAPSVPDALRAIGLAWILVAAIAIGLGGLSTHLARARAGELARQGAVRVPGDLAQFLLLGLPVILVAHVGSLTEAGITAFGITAVGMVGSALAPLGVVMLPSTVRSLRAGGIAGLRDHVRRLLRLIVPLLVGVTFATVLLGEVVAEGYLGADVAGSGPLLRLLVLAALPWGVFVALRSLVDARDARPVNARNLGAALVVFVVTSGALFSVLGAAGIALGFVLAICCLGALTAVEVARLLQVGDPPRGRGPVHLA